MDMEYKQYEPEVLKKLQQTQLGILKDFISLCEKYDLTYIMLGGTGIGVVRHQGFIPWDDDIDVAMPRKDYDVFLAMLEKEMGDKYHIQTPLTDPDYCCNVTHMQKKGTRFVPYVSRNMGCDLCISIDIFPMDNMPDDEKARRAQLKKTWILNKLIFLCGTGEPIIPLTGVKKKAAAVICRMIHMILKVLHVKPAFLYKMLVKEATRYNDQPSEYINAFEVTMSHKAYISRTELYPLRKMKYEGIEVTMPNKYDRYLRRLFGDYMTMPPEEKRVNHCPYILDFGEEE